MVYKGKLTFDKRGIIYEAYRIENITIEQCRSIFFDWALSAPDGIMLEFLHGFMNEYGIDNPQHPMTTVIKEGLEKNNITSHNRRRGGRKAHLKSRIITVKE